MEPRWWETRFAVISYFLIVILLVLGGMHVNGQTLPALEDAAYTAAVEALEAGDLVDARTRFQAIVDSPSSHDSSTVDAAQLGLLFVHRAHGDLDAFETDLRSLQSRSPDSPVIDDALLLYAQLSSERGHHTYAAEICELFLDDPVLSESDLSLDAGLLLLELHIRRHSSRGAFDTARARFDLAFPALSARADLIEARHAAEARGHLGDAMAIYRELRESASSAEIQAEAIMGSAAVMRRAKQWDHMRAALAEVVEVHGDECPAIAAEALTEEGLWQMVIDNDPQAAESTFAQVVQRYPDHSERASALLGGMRNPSTPEGTDFLWELSRREDVDVHEMVDAMLTARAVVTAGTGCSAEVLADATLSDEHRALFLYRLCFSSFYSGDERAALWLGRQIMDQFPDTDIGMAYAPAMVASSLVFQHLHEDGRAVAEAAASRLPDNHPGGWAVYARLARVCGIMRDRSAEASALAEFLARFPDSDDRAEAQRWLDTTLEVHPGVAAVAAAAAESAVDGPDEGTPSLALEALRASLLTAFDGAPDRKPIAEDTSPAEGEQVQRLDGLAALSPGGGEGADR